MAPGQAINYLQRWFSSLTLHPVFTCIQCRTLAIDPRLYILGAVHWFLLFMAGFPDRTFHPGAFCTALGHERKPVKAQCPCCQPLLAVVTLSTSSTHIPLAFATAKKSELPWERHRTTPIHEAVVVACWSASGYSVNPGPTPGYPG
jgi:hypothetical protein